MIFRKFNIAPKIRPKYRTVRIDREDHHPFYINEKRIFLFFYVELENWLRFIDSRFCYSYHGGFSSYETARKALLEIDKNYFQKRTIVKTKRTIINSEE